MVEGQASPDSTKHANVLHTQSSEHTYGLQIGIGQTWWSLETWMPEQMGPLDIGDCRWRTRALRLALLPAFTHITRPLCLYLGRLSFLLVCKLYAGIIIWVLTPVNSPRNHHVWCGWYTLQGLQDSPEQRICAFMNHTPLYIGRR